MKKPIGKPITCKICGKYGDTLVKVNDHYEHQNRASCHMLTK